MVERLLFWEGENVGELNASTEKSSHIGSTPPVGQICIAENVRMFLFCNLAFRAWTMLVGQLVWHSLPHHLSGLLNHEYSQ